MPLSCEMSPYTLFCASLIELFELSHALHTQHVMLFTLSYILYYSLTGDWHFALFVFIFSAHNSYLARSILELILFLIGHNAIHFREIALSFRYYENLDMGLIIKNERLCCDERDYL